MADLSSKMSKNYRQCTLVEISSINFIAVLAPNPKEKDFIPLFILFLFLRVNHSKNAIVKPASKSSDKDRKDVDKAMWRVKEASSIIEDEIDPGNYVIFIFNSASNSKEV